MKKILFFMIIVLAIVLCLQSTEKIKEKLPEPNIRVINNFLSINECNEIIKSCATFNRSGTSNGNDKKLSPGRTSETTYFRTGENSLIDSVKHKVSLVFGINESCMESVQITKYSKGQEYKYHHDYFRDDVKNHRKETILIYLNDLSVDDGGSTKFYHGKSFQPKVGTLLQWSNTDEQGNKNVNTLHCGKPILTDTTKYILTIWTRRFPLNSI